MTDLTEKMLKDIEGKKDARDTSNGRPDRGWLKYPRDGHLVIKQEDGTYRYWP